MPKGNVTFWGKKISAPYKPPSRSIFVWILLCGTGTKDLLAVRGIHITSLCHLCRSSTKSLDHFFLRCPSIFLWHSISSFFNIKVKLPSINALFECTCRPLLVYNSQSFSLCLLFLPFGQLSGCETNVFFDNKALSLHSALVLVMVFTK